MPRQDSTLNAPYLAALRRAKKEKAIAYKGGKCERCNGVYSSYVYDFHHTNPENKTGQPTKLLDCKWETLKAELDKCLLLCANCHRLEHHVK